MNKWDTRFMELANMVASWSKDTNRKVGAVIVNDDKIVVSMGYNGQPRGCNDNIESRNDRPAKYFYFEHSERNSLYSAVRLGVSVKDCVMYVTSFPCADCARAIIQTGIKKIFTTEPDFNHTTWGSQWKASDEMLKEAGVEVEIYKD